MVLVFRRALVLVGAVLLAQVASDAWSQNIVNRVSGVGMIDYRDKPRFKVGDWVEYHFISKNPDGTVREDYNLTLLISGEEKFWGDDCFWVETWVRGKNVPTRATAVCMSYSVFGDTAWLQRLQVYHRKVANYDPDAGIVQELMKRSMKFKATPGAHPSLTILTDTLGMDTTRIAKGLYRVQKVQRRQGLGRTEEKPDSTERTEDWDRWTLYLSRQVPITSLVKETHEKWIVRRRWQPGRSSEAVQSDLFRASGTFELVGFGSGNQIPRLTPEYARGPLRGKKPTQPSAVERVRQRRG